MGYHSIAFTDQSMMLIFSLLQDQQGKSNRTEKWKTNANISMANVSTTSGNNVPAIVPSMGGSSHDPGFGSSMKEISYGEQYVIRNETVKATKKVDSEQLAQNRGNAMLRYREKRKNRRHV